MDQWKKLGYPSYDAWALDNGLPTTNGQVDPGLALNTKGLQGTKVNPVPLGQSNSQYFADLNPFSGGTSSNSNNSNYYLPPVTYLGQSYDQSDPAQAQALLAAKQSTLGGQRDQQISQINRSLQNNLTDAGQQNAFNLAGLNQNATDYGRGLANNIVDLGQGHDIGTVNNQQKFSGLSPNAFQSGQATSEQYGNDQYSKGLTQLHQNAAETVGDNYLGTGQIDPNSTIGRQQSSLSSQYNRFLGDAQNSAQLGIQNANNAYNTGVDQNASNLQALYNYSGSPQFNYQSQGYNPNALPNVDVSQYTPYANSSQLSQSPQAQASSPATWTGSGNPFSGLLGYNSNTTQSNYLNAFLGKNPATATGS